MIFSLVKVFAIHGFNQTLKKEFNSDS